MVSNTQKIQRLPTLKLLITYSTGHWLLIKSKNETIVNPSSQNITDEALMKQIALKNARAFEVLYDRYSTRMFRYFYRLLWQDENLANDFTQDLFLKIIEKPHLFNPEKKFSTWIYSVANNLCKNAYRNKKTTETIENQSFSYFENFEEKLDFERYEAQLQVAINELSPEHRECFVLRHFEELSVKEIAEITQSQEGTVKSRLHYALKKVTEKFKMV